MLKYSPFLFGVFWFDPPWRQTCCSFVAMSNPSRPLLVTDPTPCESEWFNATATVSIFQWLLVKSHLLSPEKYPYDIPLYTTIGLLLDQHPIPILSPYRCRILRMAWSLPSSCQTARVTGTSGSGFWELGLFSQNGIWYPHPFKRLLFRGGPYPKCKLHFGTDPPPLNVNLVAERHPGVVCVEGSSKYLQNVSLHFQGAPSNLPWKM